MLKLFESSLNSKKLLKKSQVFISFFELSLKALKHFLSEFLYVLISVSIKFLSNSHKNPSTIAWQFPKIPTKSSVVHVSLLTSYIPSEINFKKNENFFYLSKKNLIISIWFINLHLLLLSTGFCHSLDWDYAFQLCWWRQYCLPQSLWEWPSSSTSTSNIVGKLKKESFKPSRWESSSLCEHICKRSKGS